MFNRYPCQSFSAIEGQLITTEYLCHLWDQAAHGFSLVVLVSFATIKLSDCDDHMEKPDRSDCGTIVAAKFASMPSSLTSDQAALLPLSFLWGHRPPTRRKRNARSKVNDSASVKSSCAQPLLPRATAVICFCQKLIRVLSATT